MTVNSTGSIDTAGEHLARFLNWLHTERASPRSISSPIPWAGCTPRRHPGAHHHQRPGEGALADHHRHAVAGSHLSDFANGIVPLSDCLGDKFCESAMNTFRAGCCS